MGLAKYFEELDNLERLANLKKRYLEFKKELEREMKRIEKLLEQEKDFQRVEKNMFIPV